MDNITGQRIHISVGIEGTSGPAFLQELGSIYGPERVLVYLLPHQKLIRLSDLKLPPSAALIKLGRRLLEGISLWQASSQSTKPASLDHSQLFTKEQLPPDTAAVHGFFSPNLFKDVVPNPFMSIILKDPLERMITLYQDWRASRGQTDWRVQIPYQKKLSFSQFALDDEFINYQSSCLGSRRLGDYDLVGVSECLPGFIAQLKNQDWTDFVNNDQEGYRLESPRYRSLGITEDFVNQFREINQMDYAIYQQAREFMGLCG